MAKARCPECGAEVDLGPSPEPGDVVECPECGARLVIKRSGRRYRLEPAEEEFEEGFEEEE